jgi:hypothetical protein
MNKNTSRLIITLLLLLSLVCFFMFVNPGRLPIVMTLVPFIVLFALIYSISQILLEIIFNLSNQKRRLVSLVLSIMPVLLLILQSISQLSIRDVWLCLAITIILIWYGLKFNSVKT